MRIAVLALCAFLAVVLSAAFAGAEASAPVSRAAPVKYANIDSTWDIKEDRHTIKNLRKNLFSTSDKRPASLAKEKKVANLLRDRVAEAQATKTFDNSWDSWAKNRRELQLSSLEKLRKSLNPPQQREQACHSCQFKDEAKKDYDADALVTAENDEASNLTPRTFTSATKRIERAPMPPL